MPATLHDQMSHAQRMILSSAYHGHRDLWDMIKPSDLGGNYRPVAEVLHALHIRDTPITAKSFMSECAKRAIDPAMATWHLYDIPADEAYRSWAAAHAGVEIEKTLLRAKAHLERGVDPWHVWDDATTAVDTLTRLEDAAVNMVPWHERDEVVGMVSSSSPFVIPDLIAEGERVLLVGKEGNGKTILLYQLAFGAAYGVGHLDYTQRYQPQRVLIVDIENVHETQVKSMYQRMDAVFRPLAPEVIAPKIGLLKAKTLDLAQPTQRRVFLDAVEGFQPNLIVMSSAYKMVAGDDYRVEAQAIQRAVDAARAICNPAVLIETHAGHGQQGDRNSWRPDGSSHWLRWPEFGLAMAPVDGLGKRAVGLRRFRGDRVSGRAWPLGWVGGGITPWTPSNDPVLEG